MKTLNFALLISCLLCGINCVRFHFLDRPAPQGLIDARRDDTRALDPAQLDRLDRPISRSGSLLLTATARVANSQMTWAANRKTLEKWGARQVHRRKGSGHQEGRQGVQEPAASRGRDTADL